MIAHILASALLDSIRTGKQIFPMILSILKSKRSFFCVNNFSRLHSQRRHTAGSSSWVIAAIGWNKFFVLSEIESSVGNREKVKIKMKLLCVMMITVWCCGISATGSGQCIYLNWFLGKFSRPMSFSRSCHNRDGKCEKWPRTRGPSV